MNQHDIIANLTRGWNLRPDSVALGTERTGLSAALWTNKEDVQEVRADPDPTQHIVSLVLTSFSADLEVGERRVAKARLRPGAIQCVRAGERPHAVIYHLHDLLQHDPSLAELAGLAGLSPFHFARAFKASTGLPPHRYQLMLRIERAKEMLVSTGLSVTEIASECGFASSQHFATLFRKMVGATPTAYRRARQS